MIYIYIQNLPGTLVSTEMKPSLQKLKISSFLTHCAPRNIIIIHINYYDNFKTSFFVFEPYVFEGFYTFPEFVITRTDVSFYIYNIIYIYMSMCTGDALTCMCTYVLYYWWTNVIESNCRSTEKILRNISYYVFFH